ncbi:hypothetical protein PVAG01_04318 [Phlyctema vagabunda]|uniref:Putative peptidase domain-containing protein n=1 Tax=Phlyctema vagabunda TaxID=108571 RepID=A0ABR4PNV4_9HELO
MRTSVVLAGAFLQALSVAAYPAQVADSKPVEKRQLFNSETTAAEYDWKAGYVSDFTIHSSCNATERHELTAALDETVVLARQAKEHILIQGNGSPIFQKYFGAGPTGPVIGWFDKIASGNRAGILFRCDDIDQNCETQDNWAGHWRGSNATSETVICPPSYTSRDRLSAVCARGFDLATGRTANYWAADLMHRLYHVPLVGEGVVDHYADGYNGVLELAAGENYTQAGMNSATLSYFAMEVYAYDIAVPGEGCVGRAVESEDDGHGHGAAATPTTSTSSTSTILETQTASVNPVRVIPAESTTTSAAAATETGSTAGQECHTHDDGVIHCV